MENRQDSSQLIGQILVRSCEAMQLIGELCPGFIGVAEPCLIFAEACILSSGEL